MRRSYRADAAVLAGLLSLPCFWLFPVLFGGHALLPVPLLLQLPPWGANPGPWDPILWDAIAYFAPARSLLHTSVAAGHVPLWTPYELCGTPFLANVQSAVLYPLGIAFWLLPPATAFGVNALIHLMLAEAFTYLWLRAEDVSRAGSAIGAIAFGLGGWAMAWLELPVFLQSAAWLPLVLFALRRHARRPSLANVGLAGVAFGCSFLAGHLQIAFYCALGAGLYALIRSSGLVTNGVRRRGVAASPFAAWLLAVALGMCMAAGQLLPSAELARYGHRQEQPTAAAYAAFVRLALPPQQLIAFLLPDVFGRPMRGDFWGPGNYSEYAGYCGVLPLLLAVAALLAWRQQRRVVALAAIEAVALLLASGTPLNAPLYFLVPGFAKFGSPGRALVLHALMVAGMAGMGWDVVVGGALRVRRAMVAPLVLVAALGVLWFAMLSLVGAAARQQASAQALDDLALFLGFLAASTVLLAAVCTGRFRPPVAAAVGAALVLLDLGLYGIGLNPTGPRYLVLPPTELTSLLQPTAPNSRVAVVNTDWPLRRTPHAVLPPNTPSAYGLLDVGGYESLYMLAYKSRLNTWLGGDASPVTNGNMVMPNGLSEEMLNQLSVRYIVSSSYLPVGGPITFVSSTNGAVVYENPAALPRAQVIGGGGAWQASVFSQAGNPNRALVALPGPAGRLVLRDVWYPGWVARALPSGRQLPISRAERVFMSVPVRANDEAVEFRYRPAAFEVGIFVGLVGLAVCVALFAGGTVALRRRMRATARARG